MGNEIFYCTECGARASGSDFAPGTSGFGAERSLCPACLGLPVVSRRDSTKKILRPATMTAVAVRPRTVPAAPPKRSFAWLIGGVFLVAAGAVAVRMALPAPPQEAPAPPVPAAALPAPPVPVPVSVEPPRCGFAQRLIRPEPVSAELEAEAEAAFAELEEAATALAEEGRVPDALARIGRFPDTYRPTRAWANLRRLRARIEHRLR